MRTFTMAAFGVVLAVLAIGGVIATVLHPRTWVTLPLTAAFGVASWRVLRTAFAAPAPEPEPWYRR